MSRTKRYPNMWHVPKVFKQFQRRIERLKLNRAARKGEELPRIRKSDDWFW